MVYGKTISRPPPGPDASAHMPRSLLLNPTSHTERDRREAHVARVATLWAVLLTALAFAAVGIAVTRLPQRSVAAASDLDVATERIAFTSRDRAVAPPPVAPPPMRPSPPETRPTAPTPRIAPLRADSGSGAPPLAPSSVAGAPAGSPVGGGSALPGAGVLGGPTGLGVPTPMTAAERGAAVRAIGPAVSAAERLRPTQAERDSVARQEWWRLRAAHDEYRPAPLTPGVGMAVGLPGGGPSRAQRLRDSVVNAGNVRRLRAIAERGQRGDSVGGELVP